MGSNDRPWGRPLEQDNKFFSDAFTKVIVQGRGLAVNFAKEPLDSCSCQNMMFHEINVSTIHLDLPIRGEETAERN